MELRSLGSDFQPDLIVEGYKSLVWTDRYRLPGDFQLKTTLVNETTKMLPLGTMVGLKGSSDCKFVESHVIEKDPDGAMELTVTGRSFETFFENRVANEDGVRMFTSNGDDLSYAGGGFSDTERKTKYNYNVNLAIPLGQFPGRTGTGGGPASEYIHEIFKSKIMNDGDLSVYVPNVTMVVESSAKEPNKPVRLLHIKLGTMYERVMDLLVMDDLGIRAVLPSPGGTILTVRVFGGADKSDTVVLSTSAGHFEKTSYAFSNVGYKNAAHAFSKWDWRYHWNSTATGLNKRHGYIDAQDIDVTNGGKAQAPSAGQRPDDKALRGRIATYLGDHKKTSVFTGEVSSNLPFKLGVDYQIGDIVRVIGDYGVNQLMRVSEYTQIEDEEGERGYPALEEPAAETG